ncbi:hypothetical protein R1sor_017136 [Riccia sorocarpa]|uniref:Uncharacterized protein n=1 Tax=Riccia sorocarpa TaxID=122646 RepID=A0ABD3I7S3_9MARC
MTVKGGSNRDKLQLLNDDEFQVALLHLAIKEDELLAIKDLVRLPKCIHAADRSGRNALHWAVAFGSREACELLFSHTGDEGIHRHDRIGRTPLHFAAIWGRSDVAKLILARGAKVNVTDRKGMTALHYAAQNTNPFLVRSLIKRGANKQARDSRKRTPYHIALQWGSPVEILDLLYPESNPKDDRPLEMPQARRFAASLYPSGYQVMRFPHVAPNSRKDLHSELLKFEMQRQADKLRRRLRRVVTKRMRKWDPPGPHSKVFALKALAARRKKLLGENQIKKRQELNQLQQIKKERIEAARRTPQSLSTSSRVREPRSANSSRHSTPSGRSTQMESLTDRVSSADVESSQILSRTPTETKSSHSSSQRMNRTAELKSSLPAKNFKATEIKSSPLSSPKFYNGGEIMKRLLTPPTFFRPNTPNSSRPPSSPKPLRPNPGARYGWPSPPGSIRAYSSKKKTFSPPLTGRNDIKPPTLKLLKRKPSPERRALSEFVGTSARHNALGNYPSPQVHRCVNVQKLQEQWLNNFCSEVAGHGYLTFAFHQLGVTEKPPETR